MRKQAVGLAIVVLLAAPAAAQPMGGAPAMPGGMPDLRVMVGKPLPAPDLPAGTVSVRVARRIPINVVVGIEVKALLKEPRGETRARTVKTNAEGRAVFEGVAPGTEFRAETEVDGERLETSAFAVPPQGGTKTMLIAGIGGPAAEPEGEAMAGGPHGAGQSAFSLGAATGAGVPDPTVAKGTVDVHVVGEDGKPVAGRDVLLGEQTDASIKPRKAQTDAAGIARFADLVGGERAGYAAVVEHEGMRLGTDPFRLPDAGGVRAEIRLAGRTTDTSRLRLAQGTRFALMPRESAFEVIEMLRIENTGSRIVDPEPAGILMPLPVGFQDAQGHDGDRRVQEIADKGVALHVAVPPGGLEVQFAFVLPAPRAALDFEQPMPFGLPSLDVRTTALPGLAIGGPLVRSQQTREFDGRRVLFVSGDGVPAGGTLSFTVSGLPGQDTRGRTPAAVLAALLVVATAVGARRPPAQHGGTASAREKLGGKRERLFKDLMTVEKARRDGETAAADAGKLEAQRKDLVGKLESVYCELARLDDERVP